LPPFIFAGATASAPFLTDHAKLINSVETFVFDCDGVVSLFPKVFSLQLAQAKKTENSLWKGIDNYITQNIILSFKNVGFDFFSLLVHFFIFLEASSTVYFSSCRYGSGLFCPFYGSGKKIVAESRLC